MKILVVSKPGELSNKTVRGLQSHGFVVNSYNPDEDSASIIRDDDGLAIMIGPELRGADPKTLIRGLRAAGEERPMLVMASDTFYSQRVALLNAGADDVFTAPCDLHEIEARIRAVVRRSRGYAKPEIELGNITLDLSARCAYAFEKKVQFTSKEYQILELLAVNRGKVLSKDTIMNHLYDYDAVPDSKIIDVFICKIRRKLTDANAGETIGTVWGQGYIIRDERNEAPQRRTARKSATQVATVPA